MKTIKANNYKKAVDELEFIEEKLSKSLGENINDSNKNHYNVIICKKTHKMSQEKYTNSFFIQTYSEQSYEKLKTSYPYLGISKIILLHDPKKNKEIKEAV